MYVRGIPIEYDPDYVEKNIKEGCCEIVKLPSKHESRYNNILIKSMDKNLTDDLINNGFFLNNVWYQVTFFKQKFKHCQKCLRFGHTIEKCKSDNFNCGICSEQHETNTCQSHLTKCFNCGDKHVCGDISCKKLNEIKRKLQDGY